MKYQDGENDEMLMKKQNLLNFMNKIEMNTHHKRQLNHSASEVQKQGAAESAFSSNKTLVHPNRHRVTNQKFNEMSIGSSEFQI